MQILFLSEIKWRYLRTRKQQIVRRFPQDWQILFVEPYTVGRENCFRPQREENITFLIVPYFKNFPQQWLQRLLSFTIMRGVVTLISALWLWFVLRRTGFRRPEAVLVSNIYYATIIKLLMGGRPVIYDCNDDHLSFPLTPKWARKYFLALCRRADRIVCSSQALRENIPHEHQPKIVTIGNGVDVSLFREHTGEISEALKVLPRPILLYLGALSEWIDFDLLQQVAAGHEDKTLALVGPVAATMRPRLQALLQMPNVKHLGEVSHDAIAAYISAADVCLIPFVKNKLTRGVNPNKLYEYLAAGKAVVSVDISPEVSALKDEIFLAEDHESFVEQINAALRAANERMTQRRQIAQANDWQEKTKQMVAVIEEARCPK
jgi:glycosyltransferase involved in cell wall biosynthesis